MSSAHVTHSLTYNPVTGAWLVDDEQSASSVSAALDLVRTMVDPGETAMVWIGLENHPAVHMNRSGGTGRATNEGMR
jgi:hypothetical protein